MLIKVGNSIIDANRIVSVVEDNGGIRVTLAGGQSLVPLHLKMSMNEFEEELGIETKEEHSFSGPHHWIA